MIHNGRFISGTVPRYKSAPRPTQFANGLATKTTLQPAGCPVSFPELSTQASALLRSPPSRPRLQPLASLLCHRLCHCEAEHLEEHQRKGDFPSQDLARLCQGCSAPGKSAEPRGWPVTWGGDNQLYGYSVSLHS